MTLTSHQSEQNQQFSFRDPSGYVFTRDQRIFRAIKHSNWSHYQNLFQQPWYADLVAKGDIQSSQWIKELACEQYEYIEHPKITFPLYPHEITAEQLYLSAVLTIRLAKIGLRNGYVLKDASAWNVLWDYGRPVFCDVTSFERHDGRALWSAYAQFCRHFIIPLLLFKYCRISPAWLFLSSRDGTSPAQASGLLGWRKWKSMPGIETVVLVELFNKKSSSRAKSSVVSDDQRSDILMSTLNRLDSYLEGLRPSKQSQKSVWADYEESRSHYRNDDLSHKSDFISAVLSQCSGAVLDLGCNQGQYSKLASKSGLKVVATDFDEGALVRLQASLAGEKISVSLTNICRPSPAIGWRNREVLSFLSRAEKQFEVVLCLGLIHHLLISERAPLEEIISLISSLTTRYAVIEWISTDDPKFREIASINIDLYKHLDENFFLSKLNEKFKIAAEQLLPSGKRKLFFLELL